MKEQIHYIGQYSESVNFRNLQIFPSGLTKMNYIISCLTNTDFKINVFSPAETKDGFWSHYHSLKVKKSDDLSIQYINTFGAPNIIFKAFRRIWTMCQIIYYLLFSVQKHDIVIIYHTFFYKWPIRIAKLFKKISIVFEIEEIFSAAWKRSEKAIMMEISFLKDASGYIVVNDFMANNIDWKKPAVICYGDYRPVGVIQTVEKKNEKINILYAGSIEGVGSDVYLAIDSLSYLNNDFLLNILGYGTTENINSMLRYIESKKFKSNISYHGCLTGKKYYVFLSKMDIGLCPRVLENKYSDFTFPSKILVYLASNLICISTPINSLMNSSISELLHFSKECSAYSIAETIMQIDSSGKPNAPKVIVDLHNNFCKNLNNLLQFINRNQSI